MDKENKKRFNHRHVIAWCFIVLLVLWSVFVCRDSYIRLFYSVIDFGIALVYSVFFLYDWCPIPAVNELKNINVISHFPQSWVALIDSFDVFIELLFTKDNFNNWLVYINPRITLITQFAMTVVMVVAVIIILSNFKKPKQNNDYGQETKFCRKYKRFCLKVVTPSYEYVKSVFAFFRSRKYYFIPAVIIFLLSTNVASICISFLAYYFYLLGSVNFASVIYQLYKLSVDLIIMLSTLPFVVWLFIGIYLFNVITVYFAYQRLDRQGAVNMRFADSCNIAVYIIGTMRAGKTSFGTSLLVFFAIKFRRMSKGIMLKVHRHFPFFPYPVLQQELLNCFKEKKIKSLASMEVYFKQKRKKFYEDPSPDKIWGYDYERYGIEHDDGNVINDIWSDLLKFGEAYLVYTEPTYFAANYSIRELHKLRTVGNMEDWDMEIYRRPSYDGEGEYAHILDHDMLRPGKKMNSKRNVYGAIEYGLIGEDEIDKERCNTLLLQEVKANAEECNQKNDLYNQHLKMIGHGANIDFKSFIRLVATSQRASSWEADGKELSDVVSIDEVSEDRLALRFFNWRLLLGDVLLKLHDSKTFTHWFNRGDTSFPVYFLWQITKPYLDYFERTVGIFGYRLLTVSRQKGTQEGEKELYKFYDQNKLIRSGMYATDSHASFFRENNLKADMSFNEIERFSELHPSYKELAEKSNSHMYKKWTEQSGVKTDSKDSRRSGKNPYSKFKFK